MMIIITKIHVAKFQEKPSAIQYKAVLTRPTKYPICKRRNFRSSNPTKIPITI